jgi:UDP-3-O-[3-hydroxymyristoyl] N-acetylglucosamine deacetylase
MTSTVSIAGVGLFSGKPGRVAITPAPPGHGISIRRVGSLSASTPLTINFLSTLPEHTCLPPGVAGRNSSISSREGEGFATVEHLLSALAGLGIADAIIELDGPEVPIGDGSAAAFVEAIRCGGWQLVATSGNAPVAPLVLHNPVEVIDPRTNARTRAIPRDRPGTSYSYLLDYGDASTFPRQSAEFDSARDDYAKEVAPARTFSLLNEAMAMQARGMFTHLTPRDMLVLDAMGRPIDNTLRFENEPARHKLLDLIGDVALLGRPLQADIVAERSGHALTHALVREILSRTL